MEVSFYKAKCGDAARIRFIGNDEKPHNIFVDGGHSITYRDSIEKDVEDIQKSGEAIDIWVVSHIHRDHIAGVLIYLHYLHTKKYAEDIVSRWFYNPPRFSVNNIKALENYKEVIDKKPKSIAEGDELTDYLIKVENLPKIDFIDSTPDVDLFGLKMIFLAPKSISLDKLRTKYEIAKNLPLEREEDDGVSTVKSRRGPKNDYIKKLKDFDLSIWEEDGSVENASSISFITELNGKRMLWMADAHPTDIVDSLKKLGYSNTNKIDCEWVKVVHHGSKKNNSNELYSLINCQNYLFSVDGFNRHCLPTKESIARILRNEHRPKNMKYHLKFMYDDRLLRRIFEEDGPGIFKKFNFEVDYHGSDRFFKID